MALVVFDVCQKDTFTRAKQWVDEVKNQAESAVILLLANKCDAPQNEW